MLFKSGQNLESGTLSFIDQHDMITLFSAYIKLEALKKLNAENKIKRIIVRWEVRDLCMGVSDLEVYQYCKANGIFLFRNTRIHLKAFWNNSNAVLFGSANVSGRGIGEKGNFNYELSGDCDTVSISDRLYFNQIIGQSNLVTDNVYDALSLAVEELQYDEQGFVEPDIEESLLGKYLMSNLPMSEELDSLFNRYQKIETLTKDIADCLVHDLSSYNIPLGLTEEDFYSCLIKNFNNNKLICSIKDYIKTSYSKSCRYGEIVRWIEQNTIEVPMPNRWEIKEKQIVNILYAWICKFDTDFRWSVPGQRSEVIFFDPK